MKGFVAGVIVGAVLYAAGDALHKSRQPPVPAEEPSKTSPSSSAADEPVPAPVVPGAASHSSFTTSRIAPVAEAAMLSTASQRVHGVGVEQEEKTLEVQYVALLQRRLAREQAERDAEAKDTSWAYSTEQQLQSLAGQHPLARTFEITSVDCRTTFCELKAEAPVVQGSRESDQPQAAFQKAMEDARLQLNLVPGDSGASSDGTRVVMYQRFGRSTS